MKKYLVVFILSLFVSSVSLGADQVCSGVNKENYDKISEGMSLTDIQKLICDGKPASSVMDYPKKGKTMKMHNFVKGNGSLTSIGIIIDPDTGKATNGKVYAE